MYEKLFSYYDLRLGVKIICVPDFRQEVARRRYYYDSAFFTDNGVVRFDQGSDPVCVYSPEEASWCFELTVNYEKYLTVTPYTKSVYIEYYNADFNKELNMLLKKKQKEYFENLNTQKRIYFYNSEKNRLKIAHHSWYDEEEYKYSMERETNSSIDKKYSIPTENCFVVGTVTKTIGNKYGRLHDFIRPIYIINAEDESYKNEVNALLRFSIKSRYSEDVIYENIKTYMMEKIGAKEAVTASPDEAAKWFCKKIEDGFKSGNIYKLRDLCYNLYWSEPY